MTIFDRLLSRLSGVSDNSAPLPSSGPAVPKALHSSHLPAPPQPVKVRSRAVSAPRGSYVSDPSATLLQLSKRDSWSIEDACAGTHILGGNGSGKTTGSGQSIAKAFLRAGFGGLVLCAKPDERENWVRYAKACGRQKHLIIVSADSEWRFNCIQYELGRSGDPASRVDNLVTTLMNLVEQTGRRTQGDEKFWQQAAEQLLRNVLMVLIASRSEFSLLDVQKFIDSIPNPVQSGDGQWQHSDTARYLHDAKEAYAAAGRPQDFEALQHYITVQFPSLATRTRSSVTFTLSAMLQDLMVGTLRELFATGTNFFPEDTHEGAIIILDLPAVLTRSNATAQTLFKVVWQTAALRRMNGMKRNARPIFLWADEAHFFVSNFDSRFQSLARAAQVCTVYMTQNISAYRASLSPSAGHDLTNWLLGLFQTHIFHAQSDPATIDHAQKLFGRRETYRSGFNNSHSVSIGASYGSSISSSSSPTGNGIGIQYGSGTTYSETASRSHSHGSSSQAVMDHVLEAHHFTTLATATDNVPKEQANLKGISQAFVFRLGRTWANGDTHLLAQFNRRIR